VIVSTNEGYKVKWSCDTLGFHEELFDTELEAQNYADSLKAESITLNTFEKWNFPLPYDSQVGIQ